ncbi:MAG: UDP-N-acetylmuramoyl-L-alanine--D-glutamate ligase, partial [Flavobacteriales bacterium]
MSRRTHNKLVVLGAGESGTGAAVLGKKEGWDVFVSDSGQIGENYKDALSAGNITWEENTHTWAELKQATTV